MFKIIKKLQVLLDRKQKRAMMGLAFLMIIGGALQTLGVGALSGVLALIMSPEKVQNNVYTQKVIEIFNISDYETFKLLVMVALIFIYILKNLFLFIQNKLTLRFVYTNQFRTSERMMRNYLRKNYEFYLNADTSIVQRNITSDVNNMYALIKTLLQLFSDGVVSIFVVGFCFWSNGLLTVVLGVVILALMLLIKVGLKPIMYKAGKDNQDYYSGLFKWISQTVMGIKEVKIACKEQHFVDEYCKCGKGYVNAVQKYSLYNEIPKLLMESVCVATMMGYMIYMSLTGVPADEIVSACGTMGVAAIVLLPCVNRINNQLNAMAYYEPFFMGVSDNLQDEIDDQNVDMSFATEEEKLPVKKMIEMQDITYRYPGTEKKIFDHASLTIPVGKSVGIVGSSGAGKSTVVDIALGLLKPEEGMILADGVDVMEHYRGWLGNIGYIPQMIFMLDDTIRHNIAFGVPDDKIDEKRLKEVLVEAQLDKFVETLPEGLDTGIGERGIRLSGGQRQRIGIARALYNDPEVLVLDEATSALDNDTEAAIMEAINRLHGKKTLVIIAHRLQTIEKCDIVYRVENGKAKIERGTV